MEVNIDKFYKKSGIHPFVVFLDDKKLDEKRTWDYYEETPRKRTIMRKI